MQRDDDNSRRAFLKGSAWMAGAALVLTACGKNETSGGTNQAATTGKTKDKDEKEEGEKEVTAVEDLMREHGVIRRALAVYTDAAMKLKKNPSDVSPDALQRTAKLFRSFGEDYHEKKLEEESIFPMIKQKGAGGEAASYPDILTAQHNRGREITDYILSSTNTQKIAANAGALADTLLAFVWMYENHATREDTIVFPAWKDLLSEDDYKELGDKFEDIEKQTFGGNGFEDAVKQISQIEASVGLSDISKFTPPPPPK